MPPAALTISTDRPVALIGAGPAGLAGARNLQKLNIPFMGFESHNDVGGLWDIDNPRSTVYHSAHLISSKRMTEFREFPMDAAVADYPGHRELRDYFRAFAREFNLYDHYRFNSTVAHIEPQDDGWLLTTAGGDTQHYGAVILANGTLAEPNMPDLPGEFDGEILHSAHYKHPRIFEDRRVLIVGAGNSGCDIAVDAVHRAARVSISVRRGYHFIPKYIFGCPADTLGGMIRLPPRWKQAIDSRLLKLFTGDPVKLGFPPADHRLYESHPIINTLVLYHLGHGDIDVRADIELLQGQTVVFKDGSQEEYDVIILATGYQLHYPFIDRRHLNWHGMAPQLFLNTFHPHSDTLYVLGMIEAAGIGWQGRYELAELVARYIDGLRRDSAAAARFQAIKSREKPDLNGGFRYLQVERMAYYVHKDTFLKQVRKHLGALKRQG